ncbi:hypothetical protein [Pedobacter sp. MR2016-24]|uniref:hypothetical protein n=1 Tax=Pedobacter sp. MR2016-24 TaxID=2994466 RepID=UPI002247C005|nr:hypothetical protein [Pedobacter sp. MR2016-24]MCX2484171.1 hypothetical protein [Pedobacter sp. MR2016-24]
MRSVSGFLEDSLKLKMNRKRAKSTGKARVVYSGSHSKGATKIGKYVLHPNP